MVVDMRALAEKTPGFVAWHDIVSVEPGSAAGAIVFESEEALSAWRDDPAHGAVHRQGEESVYRSFHVQIYELVRENVWSQAGAES